MKDFIFDNKHTWDRLTHWERELVGYESTRKERKLKKAKRLMKKASQR